MGKWSHEAVLRNRRKNKARRAFRDFPLLAWEMVGHLYENDYNLFWIDCNKQYKYRGKKRRNGKAEWFRIEQEGLIKKLKNGNVGYCEIARIQRLNDGKDYKIGVPTGNGKGFYWSLPKKLSKNDVLKCMAEVNNAKFIYQKKHILKCYTYPNYHWDSLSKAKNNQNETLG
jgi:hypothetical protein